MKRSTYPNRKHPTHTSPVERHNQPIILSVTLAIQPRIAVLDTANFHEAFKESIQEADAWSVGLYMIMPDPIHLFCRPALSPVINVNRWASYLKFCTTKILGKSDAWNWQPHCWDRQMRNQHHYRDRYAYVRMNPVRAGLVEDPDDWLYQGIVNMLEW